ncbi:MAG: 30S ribosomal protein S17 [Dehalococcoidia bacterium]
MREKRKTRTGTVIGDKMDKTVVVLVESLRRHPLYKKVVRDTSKFKVHDEANTCKVGDVVRIVETRPLSKDKCWRVVEIIGRKEVAEKEPSEVI